MLCTVLILQAWELWIQSGSRRGDTCKAGIVWSDKTKAETFACVSNDIGAKQQKGESKLRKEKQYRITIIQYSILQYSNILV